jgi:hypothetical protein
MAPYEMTEQGQNPLKNFGIEHGRSLVRILRILLRGTRSTPEIARPVIRPARSRVYNIPPSTGSRRSRKKPIPFVRSAPRRPSIVPISLSLLLINTRFINLLSRLKERVGVKPSKSRIFWSHELRTDRRPFGLGLVLTHQVLNSIVHRLRSLRDIVNHRPKSMFKRPKETHEMIFRLGSSSPLALRWR